MMHFSRIIPDDVGEGAGANMTESIFLSRRLFIQSLAVGLTELALPGIGLAHEDAGPPTISRNRRSIYRCQPEDIKRLGFDSKELDNLAQLFQDMLNEGLHPGAQLAVFRNGELAIELAGGVTGPSGESVTFNTLFQIRSITKALAAMVMMVLHDRGRFSFNDPVSKHWPEFGQNGKTAITIAHIMSHRAGIPDGPRIQPRFWNDRKVLAEAVEKMRPIWPPGSTTGYHSLSYGWILDELVYRWEGHSIASLLSSELTEPLAIKNLFLGLPWEQFPRMAKMVVDERVRENQTKRALFSDFLNTRTGISLPLAAANGVGTARSLAKLMNVLAFEGIYQGQIFFSTETLKLAGTPTNKPEEMDRRILWPVRWGLGYILGDTPHIYGRPLHPKAIGHAGGSANVAWADPERRLAVAFLCNKMLGGFKSWDRYLRVGKQVYATIGQV